MEFLNLMNQVNRNPNWNLEPFETLELIEPFNQLNQLIKPLDQLNTWTNRTLWTN